MDIFQDNNTLEELALFGLDWGLFIRHDISEPLIPFLFLKHDDHIVVRNMVIDGNPFEYATKILEDEKEPFDYVLIGGEISIKNKLGEQEDAIIIQAFDVSSEKGVSLMQAFSPKEKADFQKIGGITFMGIPDLPIPVKEKTGKAENETETTLNGLQIKNANDFLNHIGMITGKDAFQVARTARVYIREKLNDEEAYDYSGEFEINFLPEENINIAFLKFLLEQIHNDIICGEEGLHWEETTNRKLNIVFKYGEEIISREDRKPISFQQNENNVEHSSRGGCGKSAALLFLVIGSGYLISFLFK